MNALPLYERMDRQIADAGLQCGMPDRKLKFSTHIFKPDSPNLETVVAVDIGRDDPRTRVKSSIRSFYSPSLYQYDSAADLEKDIHAYLMTSMG